MQIIKKLFLTTLSICLLVTLNSCQSKKQKTIRNLSTYITISFEGSEGNATAIAEFNKEEANEEIGKIIKLDRSDNAEMLKFNTLLNDVSIDILNNSETLKNGEVLKIKVNYDKDLLEYFDLNVDEREEIEVQGLQEAKDLDVFTQLNLSFEGYSPALTPVIELNDTEDEFLKTVNFEIEEPEPYKKGQKITVNARFNNELARKYGYAISTTSKKYEVPRKSAYYVQDVAEISNSQLYNLYYAGYTEVFEKAKALDRFVLEALEETEYIKDDKEKKLYEDQKNYIDAKANINVDTAYFSKSNEYLNIINKAPEGNRLTFIYKINIQGAKVTIPDLYIAYTIKGVSVESDVTGTATEELTGELSTASPYYDNVLVDISQGIDESYETYNLNDIENLLNTEKKEQEDKDRSEEYKSPESDLSSNN